MSVRRQQRQWAFDEDGRQQMPENKIWGEGPTARIIQVHTTDELRAVSPNLDEALLRIRFDQIDAFANAILTAASDLRADGDVTLGVSAWLGTDAIVSRPQLGTFVQPDTLLCIVQELKFLLEDARALLDHNGERCALALVAGRIFEKGERLRWRIRHEPTIVKGEAGFAHERNWQRSGAQANASARRRNVAEAAAALCAIPGIDLQRLNDSDMARRLRKLGRSESDRILRGYVAEARRLGLLPRKKLAASG